MKKKEAKLHPISQSTDLEKELNELGQQGWEMKHMIGTPFGMKALLYRELDEEVTSDAKTDELMKKWS